MTGTAGHLAALRSSKRSGTTSRPGIRSSEEGGYTLVEVMLVIAMLSLVLAITVPVVSMFYDTTDDVQQTYAASNQVLLASESLSQYLHEAIPPCPTGSSTCTTTTPFLSPTASSLTFYAYTGNSNGPAQIVISTSGTTMSANMTQPVSGCPFNGSTSTACSYTGGTQRLVAQVQNLTSTSILSYLTTSGASCPGSTTGVTVASIQAVCVSLQTRLTRGQATGYASAAYPLANGYDGSVG
jgi:prepilin-type N-terminal cleavage/methylation domain-containing protein